MYVERGRERERERGREREREREMAHRCIEVIIESDVDLCSLQDQTDSVTDIALEIS